MAISRTTGKTVWVAARALLACTLLLGVGYTALLTGLGQLIFPAQANGSLLSTPAGRGVGSELIGQSFTDPAGDALPEYFQPRPSAAGDGYDGRNSSGTNWGTEHPDAVAAVARLRTEIAIREGVPEDTVPADALTASSSGLDPHISPAYAALQMARVAAARGLPSDRIHDLVARCTESPDLGILGEARINVLRLNLELDEQEGTV